MVRRDFEDLSDIQGAAGRNRQDRAWKETSDVGLASGDQSIGRNDDLPLRQEEIGGVAAMLSDKAHDVFVDERKTDDNV